MYLALISTIIWSLWVILWKKSLKLTELNWVWFMIFWYFWSIIISLILIISWKINYSIFFSYIVLFSILFILLLEIWWWKIEQRVYKNEKYSALMPFENLEKIFIVIIWFFAFWNSSLLTLFITILTIIIIFFFNVDLKTFKIPKYITDVFLVNLCWAWITLTSTYILKFSDSQSFFVYNQIAQFLMIFLILIFTLKNDIGVIFKQQKWFYLYRLSWTTLWALNYLLTLFLIKELWIIITILLSFLWIIFKLIFSYFLLKEIPTKKDLLLWFIVLVLIWIWYYFG